MTTSSYESLRHSKWACKYHVVFIPEGRKKALYGKPRIACRFVEYAHYPLPPSKIDAYLFWPT